MLINLMAVFLAALSINSVNAEKCYNSLNDLSASIT